MANDTLAFEVTLDEVSKCGQTCRVLTLTLTNIGTITAHSVSVDVTLETGGEIIWSGSTDVGTIEPDENHRESERVNLSYEDGLRVRRNDNVVTARMFIRSNEGDLILTKTVDVTTLEPAETSIPNLQSGRKKSIRFEGQTYYLIDNISNQPPNRIAVTTPNFELASLDQTRGVIRRNLWSKLSWGIDWQDEIERTQEFRKNQADNKAFGRALDLGWDITEILVFVATGYPQASIGPVLDTATDAISWTVQDVNRPYREGFQSLTASLSDSQNINHLADRVTSRDDIGNTLQKYIGGALSLAGAVKEGMVLKQAWSQVYSSGLSSGATTASSTALSKSKGFFVGFAVSTAAGQMESAIKNKSKIHGVSHAFATVRLPVLHRLKALENNLTASRYRFGNGIEYYLHLQKNYQMYALAYAVTAKYWQQISDSNIGGIIPTGNVWDFIVDAQKKADNARQTSQAMADTARRAGLILGQTLDNIDTRTQQSINAEIVSDPDINQNSIRLGGGQL
jgi:hypothetical protein